MFTLTLEMDEELISEYDFGTEAECVTLANKFIQLSRASWEYNSETKTWSCDIRTMQITES